MTESGSYSDDELDGGFYRPGTLNDFLKGANNVNKVDGKIIKETPIIRRDSVLGQKKE